MQPADLAGLLAIDCDAVRALQAPIGFALVPSFPLCAAYYGGHSQVAGLIDYVRNGKGSEGAGELL